MHIAIAISALVVLEYIALQSCNHVNSVTCIAAAEVGGVGAGSRGSDKKAQKAPDKLFMQNRTTRARVTKYIQRGARFKYSHYQLLLLLYIPAKQREAGRVCIKK